MKNILPPSPFDAMATFTYTARDSAGAAVTGTVEADSVARASQQLRADGKYPTSVEPASASASGAGGSAAGHGFPTSGGVKVSRARVVQFSQQLAVMIETGVTLSEALDCAGTQSDDPRMRRLIEDVARQVQGGTSFSAALARHPASFPRLYVSIIAAAEKSGMMAKLLVRATNYLKDEQDTVRRVKGALTYPAIMMAFAVTVTVFLLAFVLPKFAAIYSSKSAALPVPTQVLMGMSNFLVAHWMPLVAGVATAAALLWFYVQTSGGARVRDYVQLHVPLIGALFRKLYLARTLRMVGTMAGAGLNLLDCVQTAHDLCGNSYYRDLWARVADQLHTGKQLSEPLFTSPLVPRSVSQMIHSGEKSGKLAFVMEQVAGHAEAELKETIAELTRYIEPAMIVIMGGIIGGVALALLLPIFTISRVVAH
jgi:type IV pilus assembly protein PilC